VVVPAASELASPLALMLATEVDVELHATRLVTSAVLPSLYTPVAVNCRLVWTGMEEAAGDIVIDCKPPAAPVTSRLADA
jgi:hypothetical protein